MVAKSHLNNTDFQKTKNNKMKYSLIAALLVIGFSLNAQEAKTVADFKASQSDLTYMGVAQDLVYESAYVVTNDFTRQDLDLLRTELNKNNIRGAFTLQDWKYTGPLTGVKFMAFGGMKEMLCSCEANTLDKLVIIKEADEEISCYIKSK